VDGSRSDATGNRYLIQRQSLLDISLRSTLNIKHGPPLDPVFSGRDRVDPLMQTIRSEFRQETNSSKVDAQYRHLERGGKSGDSNDCPVSPECDDQIPIAAQGGQQFPIPTVAQCSVDTSGLKLGVQPERLFMRARTARMIEDRNARQQR
jgi:hypothetical protein